MKILTKNGFKFAVGMFWQIPDYARKTVNLTKVGKDTSNDMYCQINHLNATVGFCPKSALQGAKNVASLAKFIITAAKLTADYSASIICYKFKSAGELDDLGNLLKDDLFGYLVLLNGTICPIEGEYVGEFDIVRNSILEQANLYPIDTLYLPIDVADRFLNIFERLEYAYHTDDPDELLRAIMQSANKQHMENLVSLLREHSSDDTFNEIFNYIEKRVAGTVVALDGLNLSLLKKLISSEIFRNKTRDNAQVENNVRYLVASILQIPRSSNEIFWQNKLKQYHAKCLLYSIIGTKKKLYSILITMSVLAVFSYGIYSYLRVEPLILEKNQSKTPIRVKPELLTPKQLIESCLGNGNDRFFSDTGNWRLSALKCNSLGLEYQFSTMSMATVHDLANVIGTYNGVSVVAHQGKYIKRFASIKALPQLNKGTKKQISEVLEEGANTYEYKLKIEAAKSQYMPITKFLITATTSPLFLLKHGVLDEVLVDEIDMKLNTNTGVYTWTIQGAF